VYHVWRNEKCAQNFGLENLKVTGNLGDLGIDGLIVLKWILIFSLHTGHMFNFTSSLYAAEKERVGWGVGGGHELVQTT
jgi:hypothetical protein